MYKRQELDSQYEKRKQEIEKIVKNVIEKHNIEISQTAFDNLIIHLSLCISRELNGTYIPTSESQINHLKEHEYYPCLLYTSLVIPIFQFWKMNIMK